MNVLDNYKEELLNLGDPIEIDDDTYFCKFNYNNMPFMIKTNKICTFKSIKKNKDNYVNISITSKDYLVWFETFYKWCIQTFHERSEDWFEEPLTLSDVEFSFINPLKSNIKDNCFDIQCITDTNRLHIVDTKDNVNSLDLLNDTNIIPTFHIKGVKFNNKYFSLDIEVNNMLVVLDDESEEIPKDFEDNDKLNKSNKINTNEIITNQMNTNEINTNEIITNQMNTNEITESKFQNINENININKKSVYLEKEGDNDELNEVSIPTDNLEEMNIDIESSGFYKIYELLDEKIKDNMLQNIQKIFNKKKIKLNVDLTDIFDEEE
jgi:hypothetical protein